MKCGPLASGMERPNVNLEDSKEEEMAKVSKGSAKKTKGSKKTSKKSTAPKEGQSLSAATPKPKKTGGAKAPTRAPLAAKTYFAKDGEIAAKWRLIDADRQPLGRISSLIATILMGKDKAAYTRSSDTGDFVIVVNAKGIVLTGKKWEDKVYKYHTNYPGGLKVFTAQELLDKHPERIVERAVYGMLPKGHMGRQWYKKLRVFAGSEHPHAAQKPEPVKIPDLGYWERT
jgi:large subunit ribosomal protein L13